MLDGLLSDLLQVKWETSVRSKFYTWLGMFLGLLLIASLAYVTRLDFKAASKWSNGHGHEEDMQLGAMPNSNANQSQVTRVLVGPAQMTSSLFYRTATSYKLANQYSELVLVFCVLYYLFILVQRCLVEGSSRGHSHEHPQQRAARHKVSVSPMRILVQAPELTIFTCNCLIIVLCVPLRLLVPPPHQRDIEDFLAAIILFLLPMKLLFFCRGSKSLGSFIVMIYKILVNDVLCFVVFLIIFIAGFGQCK